MSAGSEAVRIGVLWRGEPRTATDEPHRMHAIFEALAGCGAEAEPVPYSDATVDEVRDRLLQLDGVLVWVDPITAGNDRSRLDPMLRDVAARGVWVSAHPDVILKMGTKDVLYRTRDLAWGADTRLYATARAFREQFPSLLALGPRVVKQHRGNGGDGVWKVEVTGAVDPSGAGTVRVLHALRGSVVEELALARFMDRCEAYFAGSGCLVDQPFQSRLGDGMIRCYLVHDHVVGFGHQFVRALMPPPAAGPDAAAVPLRLYYGPSQSEFRALKAKLESGWIAEMQRVLDIDTESLPAIWDADFLYGPRTSSGEDTYVLCEINVSSVFPMPDEAPRPLAEAAIERTLAARARRGQ